MFCYFRRGRQTPGLTQMPLGFNLTHDSDEKVSQLNQYFKICLVILKKHYPLLQENGLVQNDSQWKISGKYFAI